MTPRGLLYYPESMPSIVWRGQLTFGLVSIPVKLYRAARRERVRLRYVHRPTVAEPDYDDDLEEPAEPEQKAPPPRMETQMVGRPQLGPETAAPAPEREPPPTVSRVRQALINESNEQPVPRSEVLRGYEVEPDRYVVLDPDDMRRLQRRTSPTMEIIRSVKLSEIDPVFFETSYYLVPDRGGEKAYAILFKALRETGHVALARVGMHGREHVVIVRPGRHGMLAHTMFYTDEIRFENEFRTDAESVGAKELQLAKTFLEALEAPFAPEEFKDAYREELEAMIAKKAAQSKVAAPARPSVAAAPVVDILEALKKSIGMARKPPAAEPQPTRKAPGKVTEIKNKRQSRKAP